MNPSKVRSSLEAVFTASDFSSLKLSKDYQEIYYSIFTKRLQSPNSDWRTAGLTDRELQVLSTQKFAAFFRKCILEMETHVRENRIETICYSMPKHLSTGVEKIDGKLIELGLLELPYPIKSEVTSIVKQLNEIEDIDDISEQEKDYLVSRLINKYEGSPDVVIFLAKYSKQQFTKKYYSITYTQPKQATPVRSLPFGEERRALLHQRFKNFRSQKI